VSVLVGRAWWRSMPFLDRDRRVQPRLRTIPVDGRASASKMFRATVRVILNEQRRRTDLSPVGIRLWGLPGCHRPGTATQKGSPDDHRSRSMHHPPYRRTVRRAAPRPADELLAALADGVLELTTSEGWRRYLRAMATLRTLFRL